MLIWQVAVVVINLSLTVIALLGFRYSMSAIIGVHAKDELDKKDNFAFGIAIAGGVLALMMIMSGSVTGTAQASLLDEFIFIVIYAVLGVVLLKIGYLIQDKILLRGFSTSEQIKSGNVAAGLVVAVNLVAIGIVIRNAISWVEHDGYMGIIPVLLVFLASQFILGFVTGIRAFVYAKRNSGKSWETAICENNIAIALRFCGQLIATALALSCVGSLLDYTNTEVMAVMAGWFFVGILIMLIVWVLYRLAFPIVLTNVDVTEEVDVQQNVGVAAVEAALFVGIASLMLGFISQ